MFSKKRLNTTKKTTTTPTTSSPFPVISGVRFMAGTRDGRKTDSSPSRPILGTRNGR
jgi:hypothetical protein